MRHLGAWLLACALSLTATSALASLNLSLTADGLSPAQQQATQTLLDEALLALPPSFVRDLDRRVEVRWSADMPANAYGQASGPYRLDLN
ncbi:MAG: hypothetical protein ABWY17_22245, partial [Pseudomonas sp.]